MARQKKPQNETNEEAIIRRKLETISNTASRSQKTAWNRKMDNMVKLMAKLRPIEQQILELMSQKNPIFDEIQVLRQTMIKECTHPFEYLSDQGDHVVCKFCDKKIQLRNEG